MHNDYVIVNKLGFFSALFGLLAALTMAMSSGGILGDIGDGMTKWSKIDTALKVLHSYDTSKVGAMGHLYAGEYGFDELVSTLSDDYPFLPYYNPDELMMNTVVTFGGAPRKVLHAMKGQYSRPINTIENVQLSLSYKKQEYYLYFGLLLLTLSFLLGAMQFIKKV